MSITMTVYGIPGPQGSKKNVGRRKNGSAILVESSAKVKPWRDAVRAAAVEQGVAGRLLDGPLYLEVTFTLPRPQRMPTGRWAPCVHPDLSKLVRSTEDALTDARVWGDDGQVTRTLAEKTYTDVSGINGLTRPGAQITICAIDDGEA